MQLSHSRPVASAIFDDPNLVSCAGLVPMVGLAQQCDLAAVADEHLRLPTDKGANAGAKVTSLVAGMVAGADSIDDMALLRHGAMGALFDRPYAPSTLGSFLREFTFGHVRQLDAVAARVLTRLGERTPLVAGIDGPVLVDIDDTIVEVHGYAKQGSGYGYCGVRGLNALITTVTTDQAPPVILGQRLRKGACGSPRGAARMVCDTLAAVRRLRSTVSTGKVLLRADSAFYGHPTVSAAIRGGAELIGSWTRPRGKMEEAKDLLAKGAEKAEEAIEKAGDAIDSKTEGKFKETVDKVQDAAKKAVDKGNPQA